MKKRVSIAICGDTGAGKSTLSSRLEYDLGGRNKTMPFPFYREYQERSRPPITNVDREFFTETKLFSILCLTGDFVEHLLAQTNWIDVAVLIVDASAAEAKANDVFDKSLYIARVLNLLGVKQLIVCVNKIDAIAYNHARFIDIAAQIKLLLAQAGWEERRVPILPIAVWPGDNICASSGNTPWWVGSDISVAEGRTAHILTLSDALEKTVAVGEPTALGSAKLRMPLSGVYRIKGIGNWFFGRVEQAISLDACVVLRFTTCF